MKEIRLSSYAKVNLILKIKRKREDGYHELVTVFERIDLCDTLIFREQASGIRITCDNRSLPCDQRNIVYKAAHLLQQRSKIRKGVWIHIQKRIPVGAGLAGGSSNAATTLQGLNELWKAGLPQRQLIELGNVLGSDIAFFLNGSSFALGKGRGEKIHTLHSRSRLWHVLITPRPPLLTKEVYSVHSRYFKSSKPTQLTKNNDDVSIHLRSLKKGDIQGVQRSLSNDLEKAIVTLRPGLLRLKERIMKFQPLGVCFSGSGPSIFAVTRDQKQAEAIASHFRKIYKQVFVVTTK